MLLYLIPAIQLAEQKMYKFPQRITAASENPFCFGILSVPFDAAFCWASTAPDSEKKQSRL